MPLMIETHFLQYTHKVIPTTEKHTVPGRDASQPSSTWFPPLDPMPFSWNHLSLDHRFVFVVVYALGGTESPLWHVTVAS